MSAAVGITAGGVAQPASATRARSAAAAKLLAVAVMVDALQASAPVIAQSGLTGKSAMFLQHPDTKSVRKVLCVLRFAGVEDESLPRLFKLDQNLPSRPEAQGVRRSKSRSDA